MITLCNTNSLKNIYISWIIIRMNTVKRMTNPKLKIDNYLKLDKNSNNMCCVFKRKITINYEYITGMDIKIIMNVL